MVEQAENQGWEVLEGAEMGEKCKGDGRVADFGFGQFLRDVAGHMGTRCEKMREDQDLRGTFMDQFINCGLNAGLGKFKECTGDLGQLRTGLFAQTGRQSNHLVVRGASAASVRNE